MSLTQGMLAGLVIAVIAISVQLVIIAGILGGILSELKRRR